MENATFEKVTEGFANALKNNPFSVADSAPEFQKAAHVGYALGIEDALFILSTVLLKEAADTPALKAKAEQYLRSMDSQRPLRRMLKLPTEYGASLVG